MGIFFDCNLSHELRQIINSSPIFIYDENEKKNFTFICSIMDRLDDSILFLNTHNNLPQTLDDFLLFMVHACIVNDPLLKMSDNPGYSQLHYNIPMLKPLKRNLVKSHTFPARQDLQ